MATLKDLLSNMISKIHTKMDKVEITENDEGKLIGVDNGSIGLVDAPVPEITVDDNGKFLRVVDGVWKAVDVPSAEEASF